MNTVLHSRAGRRGGGVSGEVHERIEVGELETQRLHHLVPQRLRQPVQTAQARSHFGQRRDGHGKVGEVADSNIASR